MGQSKVSMVVPCYNKEEYISDMLRSVYNQVWDNIELILVNDGSTDGTRRVISEWEPKLRQRGYDVVIIDQENQGVATAVKNGLLRMTGEYVCIADSDDELYPEYVSAMAEYLGGNPEYEWCVCDFDIFYSKQGILKNGSKLLDRADMTKLTVEDFILCRYFRAVWRILVRTEYFKACGIVEHIPAVQRITHEAYIYMPLFAGGKPAGRVAKPLYKYMDEIGGITDAGGLQKQKVYEDTYIRAIRHTLEWLDIAPEVKLRLEAVAMMKYHYELLNYCFKHDMSRADKEAAVLGFEDCISKSAHLGFPPLVPGAVVKLLLVDNVSHYTVRSALEYVIMNGFENEVKKLLECNGRIIGYGALGKIAASHVPQLVGTCFENSVLWDKRAQPGAMLGELPVKTPDFESLTENDIIFVYPKDEAVISEVKQMVRGNRVKGRFVYYEDFKEMWSALILPQLVTSGGC